MTFRSAFHSLLLAVIPSASLLAQVPSQYAVQRDTIRYELLNPFRMYWLRGADTSGDRMHEASVETHSWSGTSTHPVVRVAYQSLDVNRSAKSNEYVLEPQGKVLMVDGKPPAAGDRADLLMPLPAVPLRAGVQWTDTSATGSDSGKVGDEHDEAIRTYQVARIHDTLGTRVAEIRAKGSWHMKLSFWADSTAKRIAWLNVKGPMDEHDLFDMTHGLLLLRAWKMDLRGRGVAPTGALDTIAAGLLSEETMHVSNTPRTRFLLSPLPGIDNSVTVSVPQNSPILLHTILRKTNEITSGLVRNDGMQGIAHAQFEGVSFRGYDATWADSGEALFTEHISLDGDQILVHRSQGEDFKASVPEGAWGVADYAMDELLVPALLSIPRDGIAHPFAVYRPFPGHWDRGTVTIQLRAVALICVLKFGDDTPQVVLLSPDGDFLYGEDGKPTSAKRFPIDAARREKLTAILAALNPKS